ncbi:anaerobic ribonucleoside-triphosphate reductase [Cytophagaceae bacterium ABcell3]|nr:anaerobic ribonucleoside-triphosphate reductase [Cytophagaceae bacterium ABcell3]
MKDPIQLLLEQNEEKRSKCLVFTRVMGYHRPVESFNTGKKGEHKQRKHFLENRRSCKTGL